MAAAHLSAKIAKFAHESAEENDDWQEFVIAIANACRAAIFAKKK